MATPDLTKIRTMLKNGNIFSLTNDQYRKLTGLNIPKGDWYLKNRSLISKLAADFGYKISIVERVLSFEKEK